MSIFSVWYISMLIYFILYYRSSSVGLSPSPIYSIHDVSLHCERGAGPTRMYGISVTAAPSIIGGAVRVYLCLFS